MHMPQCSSFSFWSFSSAGVFAQEAQKRPAPFLALFVARQHPVQAKPFLAGLLRLLRTAELALQPAHPVVAFAGRGLDAAERLQLPQRLLLVRSRKVCRQTQMRLPVLHSRVQLQRLADAGFTLLRLPRMQQARAVIVPELGRLLHDERFLERLQRPARFSVLAAVQEQLGELQAGAAVARIGVDLPAERGSPAAGADRLQQARRQADESAIQNIQDGKQDDQGKEGIAEKSP
ncbi:hypothetical protein BN871_AJ_00090 [Paenibacillus sp. P22]|nr:hypothetical protein BN871_AJ_00090 [Paenibacillus sp. P22]